MIAAILLTIVALAHLYRLATHFQIILGSHTIPEWVSYLGVLIPGGLAVMLFRESRG
jgi:hypothetical protein